MTYVLTCAANQVPGDLVLLTAGVMTYVPTCAANQVPGDLVLCEICVPGARAVSTLRGKTHSCVPQNDMFIDASELIATDEHPSKRDQPGGGCSGGCCLARIGRSSKVDGAVPLWRSKLLIRTVNLAETAKWRALQTHGTLRDESTQDRREYRDS